MEITHDKSKIKILAFLGVSTVLGTHSFTGVRTQAGALTRPKKR